MSIPPDHLKDHLQDYRDSMGGRPPTSLQDLTAIALWCRVWCRVRLPLLAGSDRSPGNHVLSELKKVEGSQQQDTPSDFPGEAETRPYEAGCPIDPCRSRLKPFGNFPDHYSRIHRSVKLSPEERSRLDSKFYQCDCGKMRLVSSPKLCGCGRHPAPYVSTR
jgi:hypothetical protein